MCVNFKFSKKADFSSECCCKLKLKLFVQVVLNRLAHEHVYRLVTLRLFLNTLFLFRFVKFINSCGMSVLEAKHQQGKFSRGYKKHFLNMIMALVFVILKHSLQ